MRGTPEVTTLIFTTLLLVHSHSTHLFDTFFFISVALSQVHCGTTMHAQHYPRRKWHKAGRNKHTAEWTTYAYTYVKNAKINRKLLPATTWNAAGRPYILGIRKIYLKKGKKGIKNVFKITFLTCEVKVYRMQRKFRTEICKLKLPLLPFVTHTPLL